MTYINKLEDLYRVALMTGFCRDDLKWVVSEDIYRWLMTFHKFKMYKDELPCTYNGIKIEVLYEYKGINFLALAIDV